MFDLSVVIVSYNVRELLGACLRSVYTSASSRTDKPLSVEIWVVDNASGDGSAEIVRQEFPGVNLIANETNGGFAAANNQALRQCNGRFILLLNPDTVVQNDAIPRMIAFLEEHAKVGAVGAKLLNADGSLQHSAFKFPNLWMSFFDFFPINHRIINSRLNGRYPTSYYDAPFPIDHPLGACILARNTVFKQVGLLDEGFYMYCEEVDWCIRVRRAGWEIYCVPQAQVVHYGGQSTRQFRGPMLVELHRSRSRLFRKHYSSPFRLAVRQILRLGVTREAAGAFLDAARGRLGKEELAERLETYRQIMRI